MLFLICMHINGGYHKYNFYSNYDEVVVVS